MNCIDSVILYFCHILLWFTCEQIEKDDDIELSYTASVYHGSHDLSNNVPMIQQVDWSYSYLFLLWLQNC